MTLSVQSVVNHDALYSFQNVLQSFNGGLPGVHDSHLNRTLTIFSNGCLDDTGNRDCSAACQNASLIFGNISTLQNCMLYPVIANAWAEGNLENDSVAIASDYGFEKEANPSPGQGSAQISQCLTDYCVSNSGCPVLGTAQSSIDRLARLCDSDTGNICYEYTNICPTVYAPVLDDIAGVGVSFTNSVGNVSKQLMLDRYTLRTGCRME